MRTIIQSILCCCLFTGLSFQGYSQYDDEIQDSVILENRNKPDRRMREIKPLKLDNFFVGSGISLNFWGQQFRFDLLPYFGYRIGNFFAPAVGMSYIYFNDFPTQSSMNIYGPKVMARIRPFAKFLPLSGVYLHGEYEYLIVDAKQNNNNLRAYQPRENVGMGYTTNFEKGFGMTYEILFDLYWLRHGSIFYPPITYRIGFYYGF
jgi:hypothetical protein